MEEDNLLHFVVCFDKICQNISENQLINDNRIQEGIFHLFPLDKLKSEKKQNK